MADLTPKTRSESFLNGEDLEPITRREHFYAGRENELPEGHQEPETREEWFIQKYREAGDVTVESLSITENGTYTAPSGKAYSPVSVNVPLPSNAYLLKSIENVDIATFADGTDNFLKSLEIAIEPQQDLHGYDAPWVGGAGKNKCPINEATITGETFIIDTDINIASGTWTFSFESAVATSCSLRITDADGNTLANAGISNQLRAVTVTIDAVGKHLKFYGYAGTYKKIQLEEGSTATTFAPYSNICPISGWDECNVTVADDLENPTVSNVYTIDLDGTRYGGTLDVVSGELTVDRVSVVFDGSNDEKWQADTAGLSNDGFVCFRAYLQNNNIKKPEGTVSTISYIGKMLSNTMPTLKNGDVNQYPMANTVMGITGYSGTPNNYFYINTNKTLSNIQSVAELRAWLAENPTTVCYELATPLTIQLTPTIIKSLQGENNLFASTGEIDFLQYWGR